MNRKRFSGIFMPIMFDAGTKSEGGDTKAAAELRVKELAEEAFKAKASEFVGLELKSDAAKELIKLVAEEVVSKLTVKDVDGKEKSLETIVKELQEQHDKFATKFNNSGQGATKSGIYIDFVRKNLAENPNPDQDRNYQKALQLKAPALMTTANVTPNVAGGFSPLFGNYIDNEIGSVPKPANVILPLVTVKNQPGTESIWYSDRINEEGDAEFIAEGALKPLADAEWVTTKAPIVEVAVRWKMTKRLINHAPSVVADFLEHAYELVDAKIDGGILSGTGLTNQPSGITTLASAFVVPPALAGYYQDANIFDVIGAMASRIRLSNFNGQLTAVLNSVWEAKFQGIKDSEGRYNMPPFVSPSGDRIGSVNIRFSNRIGDDEILIGELGRFNVVMAENVQYEEGYENDDFSKNLVSRKLEAFLGTYIKRSAAGSILFDNISSVLTDIAAPDPVPVP